LYFDSLFETFPYNATSVGDIAGNHYQFVYGTTTWREDSRPHVCVKTYNCYNDFSGVRYYPNHWERSTASPSLGSGYELVEPSTMAWGAIPSGAPARFVPIYFKNIIVSNTRFRGGVPLV
jgi:hypothetical protein